MQTAVRIALLFLIGGICGLTSLKAAQAQSTTDSLGKIGRPFRVKIGGFYPSEGEVRDNSGDVIRSFGLSYDFFSTPTTLPLIAGVYINDSGDNHNRTYGKVSLGAETSVTGIGFQARTYLIPNAKTFNFYGGAGIGFYALHIKTGVPDRKTFVSDSTDSTRLGGKVFSGIEWKKRFFGELEYTFPGSLQVGGQSFLMNGMNASLGCRF